MEVATRREGDIVIADLAGRLVLGQPQETLRETMNGLLAADHKKIVLNVSDLARLDSTGVGELVACLRSAREADARLVLLQVKDTVRRILDVSQVLPLFETFDSEAAAIEALRS